jgi:hypothetical protein
MNVLSGVESISSKVVRRGSGASFNLFEVLRVAMGGVDMAAIGTCLPSVMAKWLGFVAC